MISAFLLAAATPKFDPMEFFAGQTRGEGQLKVVLRRPVPVSVTGTGRIVGDGTLILDQVVRAGAKPARSRQWRLRQVAPGRYTGSLSDARGPVLGKVDGNRLHLSFVGTNGFRIQQWLTLAGDGHSALNRLEARRFGVKVATLNEQITKVD